MALNNKIIGARIKEYRLLKFISQADLAERVNMSSAYISYIETGKKQVSLESLVRIVDVLGITVNHILKGNQAYDLLEYQTDMGLLFEDCSIFEKRVIYDIALAAKKSLIENKDLQVK